MLRRPGECPLASRLWTAVLPAWLKSQCSTLDLPGLLDCSSAPSLRHDRLEAMTGSSAMQKNDRSTSERRVAGYATKIGHPIQVAFIGSGAWATAAARLVAYNVAEAVNRESFRPTVKMWVHEELFEGRRLSELINKKQENVKYLPGIKLPENIVAHSNIQEVAGDANILVVCTPHQFIPNICRELAGKIDSSTCVAVSLTKGMHIAEEGPQLVSAMIKRSLGLDCSVLMGANIAEEVGRDQLSEGTIGTADQAHGQLLQQLFESEHYLITTVPDVAGVEMAGTLKNVVALGAGFVDGLGAGMNSKATILRHGLSEMLSFAQELFPSVQSSTFMESCGVADLVASCYGGRNRKVAEAFVKAVLSGKPKTFDDLEVELLAGQKLQGLLTSNEVQKILEVNGWVQKYPLFSVINAIARGKIHPSSILSYRQAALDPQFQTRQKSHSKEG